MNRIYRFYELVDRYGWKCALTSAKEFMLYNFGGMYIGRYDPSTFGRSSEDSNQVLYVSPDDIEYFQPSLFRRFVDGFDREEHHNPVIGGHWDRLRVSLEDRVFYRSLEEHFLEGVPWEETVFIQQCLDDIEAGQRTWHRSTTESDVFDRAEEVDRLYELIRDEGYRSHTDLGKSVTSEITVNIARDGSLIQSVGGKHRITITKLLDLDEIPVRVFARHRKWENEGQSKSRNSHPDSSSTSD